MGDPERASGQGGELSGRGIMREPLPAGRRLFCRIRRTADILIYPFTEKRVLYKM